MGKYLFPGMHKGMVSGMATYTAENAKRIKAQRLEDAAGFSCPTTKQALCRTCAL